MLKTATATPTEDSAPMVTGQQHAAPNRALVVSHPCVIPANQSVFAFLAHHGWRLDLVVPSQWSHPYADGQIAAIKLPDLEGGFHRRRVAMVGQPQRHFYPNGCSRVLRRVMPDVAFVEEESFSIPAFQWGLACWRRGIPFGVQSDENLERALPLPARICRAWTLRHAAFVAARSPKAKELTERWGARGRVEVIPHAVPSWPSASVKKGSGTFTIGFAGRLVPEKGLFDLLAAACRLPAPVRVMIVGNGPLKDELAQVRHEGVEIEIATDIKHEDMARAFAAMDVLALPSRTTRTWAEQFGRVLVEALWCGVPVVGSDSGEIPWVIETTGGGLVFPEGDVAALAAALDSLRRQPDERSRLASTGREAVERLFSTEAAGHALGELLASAARTAATSRATR